MNGERIIGIGRNMIIGSVVVMVLWFMGSGIYRGVVWISQLPPPPTPTATPPCVFKHTAIAEVEGSGVSRILETFEGNMWWVLTDTPNQYEWRMDEETKTAHETWWQEVQDKDQLINGAIDNVLWQSDFILPPAMFDDPNPYVINVSECGQGGIARAVTTVTVGSNYVSPYGYTTTLKLDASTGYIEIATPAGSQMAMSFPSQVFLDVIAAGWNTGETPAGSIFEGPPQSNSNREAYLESLFQTIIATKDYGLEIAAFAFAPDDFIGRSEIKRVLAGAIRINAADFSDPVAVSVLGYLSENQTASALATLHSDGISIVGGFLGPIGGAIGDGGGTDFNYQQSVTTERLLRGSVYLMPVGR